MALQQIWKFRLEIRGEQNINLPEGAEVLHVGLQGHELYLWAIINPYAPPRSRMFRVVATGQPFEFDNWDYIDTVIDNKDILGPFVWHIFIRKDDDERD